jgi:hypothetical protein
MAKRRKGGMRKYSRRKKISGVRDEIIGLGTGIIGAAIVTTVVNKFAGGHHRGGGDPDGPDSGGPDGGGPMQGVYDFIGDISGRMGLPAPMIIKAGVGLGFVVAAEKMPQHKTPLLFIAGILFWDAITSHPKVRHFMGIHGPVLSEMNAIEADLRKECEVLKGVLSDMGVLPGSPSVNGVPGGYELNGTVLSDKHMEESSYSALGL